MTAVLSLPPRSARLLRRTRSSSSGIPETKKTHRNKVKKSGWGGVHFAGYSLAAAAAWGSCVCVCVVRVTQMRGGDWTGGGAIGVIKTFIFYNPPPIPPLFLFPMGFFNIYFFAHQLFWQITRSLQGLVQQITLIRPGNALQKNAAAAVAAAVVRWRGVLLLCFRFGIVTTQPCHLHLHSQKKRFV
jgi:hypothetical protein